MRWLLFLLFVLQILSAEAGTYRCSICNKMVTKVFSPQSLATGEKKSICGLCLVRPQCAVCKLPVKPGEEHQLEDGRLFCAEDFQNGLFNEENIAPVLYETMREMERTFWRFLKFPESNVVISVVGAKELQQLAGVADQATNEIRGLTVTKGTMVVAENAAPRRRLQHQIYILSGLPRPRLMATCAHELGHVWLHENLKSSRRIDPNVEEGFCELLAHEMMDALNLPFEKVMIEGNPYSVGQQFNMIEAEKQYGLYKIVEWMKNGVDETISAGDLDRIRVVETPAENAVATPVKIVAFQTSVPDVLTLKGISGAGIRRIVLINNQTLEKNESAIVRVGSTNVTVRCLEIRERSTVIKVQETGEERELFISTAAPR